MQLLDEGPKGASNLSGSLGPSCSQHCASDWAKWVGRWLIMNAVFVEAISGDLLRPDVVWLCVIVCRDGVFAGCVQEQERKHRWELYEDVGRTNLIVATCSYSKNSVILSVYLFVILIFHSAVVRPAHKWVNAAWLFFGWTILLRRKILSPDRLRFAIATENQ